MTYVIEIIRMGIEALKIIEVLWKIKSYLENKGKNKAEKQLCKKANIKQGIKIEQIKKLEVNYRLPTTLSITIFEKTSYNYETLLPRKQSAN